MKLSGCWICVHLDYYEKDGYEDSSESGYYCDKRDDEPHLKFKEFPSKRKLRCLNTGEKHLVPPKVIFVDPYGSYPHHYQNPRSTNLHTEKDCPLCKLGIPFKEKTNENSNT